MELHPTQFILIKYIFSEDVFCLDLLFFEASYSMMYLWPSLIVFCLINRFLIG